MTKKILIEEEPLCYGDREHEWLYMLGSTDSRQEWTEWKEYCPHCGAFRIVRENYYRNGVKYSFVYEIMKGE